MEFLYKKIYIFKNNIIIKIFIFYNYQYILNIQIYGDWGLGIGDWGLGIWELGQNPKPQTPNPKPQTP
jgi:hypothetical protein